MNIRIYNYINIHVYDNIYIIYTHTCVCVYAYIMSSRYRLSPGRGMRLTAPGDGPAAVGSATER